MKIMRWMSIVMLSTVLASLLSLWTAWSMINMYADRLLQKAHIKDLSQNIRFSDLLSQFAEQLNIMGTGGASSDKSGKDMAEKNSSNDTSKDSSQPVADSGQEDAVPAWSQGSSEHSQSGNEQDKQVVMSAEEFYNKKESLSDGDKMKVFSLLASKLPQKEMQQISLYVEDGITKQELKEVQAIIEKYLSKEEYEQLMVILNKK